MTHPSAVHGFFVTLLAALAAAVPKMARAVPVE